MPAFRQVGEKQLPQEIIFMAWSPKRDLIALANKIGEVLLHRLANFQRVWSLPPSDSTGKDVTALAWRPDGKILAFGLADTKKVILCDVEKPESLHSFSVDAPITYMHWMEVTEENSVLTSFYDAEDESNLLLPKLPALPKKVFLIYAYGMYKIATVTGVIGSCLALCLSSDLKSLSVITEVEVSPESDPEITYFQLDTSLLSTYLPEVTRMARKFTHISTLLQYIKLSLTCMCEAWEEILIQMDSRLTKFVQEKNTTTSVQDEFMQLLLWGKASLELQALLMNQLTVKGLKKLGQSMESSYSSIQKLVISHLQSGSEALLYHLSELKGMAAWKQKYECLGLDASGIEEAVTAVGFVPLKVWLIIPTTETHVDVMTQKDITFVADFLTEHFNEAPELYNRKGKYFNVERVGQYLKDEDDDLVSPPNTEGNQWFNFLKNSNHLKESPLLFPYYPQKSLHFVKRQMEGIIDQCLQKPSDVIGKSVHQAFSMPLYKASKSEDSASHLFKLPFLWNDKTSNLHYVLFTMLENSISKIYILRRPTDVSRSANNGLLAIDFGNFLNNSISESSSTSFYSCLDAHFYDDDTITVIITENAEQEGKERILAQLPLSSIYTEENQELEFSWNSGQRLDMQCDGIPTRTVTIEGQWRMLENMKAQYVAVNGVRKVSCVLSSNLRHIRVFEMDVEDDGEAEEEEEEEATQVVGPDQEELKQTTENPEKSVCSDSVELADQIEEHESSLRV
uniref:Anaphase-promoting complex subunit 4 n=1 Tax=Anolis carolinensis TaxID=28377 RepID=A0A803SNM9_ANOCA